MVRESESHLGFTCERFYQATLAASDLDLKSDRARAREHRAGVRAAPTGEVEVGSYSSPAADKTQPGPPKPRVGASRDCGRFLKFAACAHCKLKTNHGLATGLS